MPSARFVWSLIVGGILLADPGVRLARAAAEPPPALGLAGVPARHRQYKTLEREILLAGATARAERWRRALETWREPQRGRRLAAMASRPPRHPTGPIEHGPAARPPHRAAGAQPPDVMLNDAQSDITLGSTQAEATIAAFGDGVVAAWNDGENLPDGPSGIGFGWSADGGETWTDGGIPPLAGGVTRWVSDPVLTVDERTGSFYLCGMAIAVGPVNAIAVVEGRFDDQGFAWRTPRIARVVRDTLPDKPWIAADSLDGRLHLSYTTFYRVDGRTRDEIEYQSSSDGNLTWSAPRLLSLPDEEGLVQGSRPAVGPDGEVHVVWKTVDTSSTSDGRDPVRLRSSRDGGKTFGPRFDVGTMFSNFGSGAPGFNRGNGIAFPAIAVDRSHGPHRGRIYVAWNECLDFYDDPLGTGGAVTEVEPNDSREHATPFVVGDVVRGEADGLDLFRFHGERGRTLIVHADSLADSLDVSLRVWCRDLETPLAFSAPVRVVQRFLQFTLPEDGDYFMAVGGAGSGAAGYRIATGFGSPGAERGRDHRDAFVTASDDGAIWSEPVRINDEPPWFDDWLPEVAVGSDGTVWSTWYDWRDTPAGSCGGMSNVYLAQSLDGGGSWRTLGPVSSQATAWGETSANLAPNQGDYLALFVNGRAVYPCWSDGRASTPDVFASVWPAGTTAIQLSLVALEVEAARVSLTWQDANAEVVVADVERRRGDEPWRTVGRVTADAEGRLVFVDREVEPGRYAYRLAAADGGDWRAGEVEVEVPAASSRLAIERVHPNPSSRQLIVAYTLPTTAPATIELLDAGGRRVRSLRLPLAAGPGQVDLGAGGALPAGVYVIRLAQSGRAATAKVAVVR